MGQGDLQVQREKAHMAKFDLDTYETVGERIAKAHEKYPDLRIVTNLVETVRDEANRPLQYVVQAQIWLGDVLKGQDYAEEIVGNGPVNKTSALENCTTSAIGRALACGLALQGTDPRKTRPSREEMEKVERMQNQPAKMQSAEEEALALEGFAQIADIADMDELKNFYSGAAQAGILHVNIDGMTLNKLISKRKKELEA